ncbi:OadG family transporter subunit [Anaerosacchariphilus polymeriproducens]|uniref:Uncharacterized protein n=1 Tax=Anaerosacchariphilus polymeriproducens TaxID=1812858 RepID=A0A371AU89_9FIRM|nr:OadG family transporter subunit [Anaerosacchariphilus polymeriproducens]RDU23133.1 hypothetical protein DWV06_12290 [Anaerosacchariphilus polymeriproducens]
MKKIRFILCLLVFCFIMTACGNKKESAADQDFNGKTKQELQGSSEKLLNELIEIPDEELNNYLKSNDKLTIELVESWIKIKDKVGKRVGIEKFEVSESGHNVTTILTENFEKKPVTLTITYNSKMEVKSQNTDIVYTKSEIIEKAFLNILMILGIVFSVLIIISIIISFFGLIPKIQNVLKKDTDIDDIIIEQETVVIKEELNLVDDLELVAVISAAIAASTGTSIDSFVVRTIKRRNNKWQKA